MKHDKDKARLDLVPGVVLRQESGAYERLVPMGFDMAWERPGGDPHGALCRWTPGPASVSCSARSG
jgi:hypothetical protein